MSEIKILAIESSCDETAAAVMARLTERGLKVPDDVSVTGFDDFYFFLKHNKIKLSIL